MARIPFDIHCSFSCDMTRGELRARWSVQGGGGQNLSPNASKTTPPSHEDALSKLGGFRGPIRGRTRLTPCYYVAFSTSF